MFKIDPDIEVENKKFIDSMQLAIEGNIQKFRGDTAYFCFSFRY